MELFEWLSVLGGGLFCGVKILKRFYGWAAWVAERKKELREWRLQGVKPCGSWECGHWEISNTQDGGIALQHNDLEVWQSMRELDFYMKRYELFRIPIPAKVMSKI